MTAPLNSRGERMLIEQFGDTMTFIGGAPLHVPNLERYWRDPAPYDAQREPGQAAIDALFEPHRERLRAEQEARWERESTDTLCPYGDTEGTGL